MDNSEDSKSSCDDVEFTRNSLIKSGVKRRNSNPKQESIMGM